MFKTDYSLVSIERYAPCTKEEYFEEEDIKVEKEDIKDEVSIENDAPYGGHPNKVICSKKNSAHPFQTSKCDLLNQK